MADKVAAPNPEPRVEASAFLLAPAVLGDGHSGRVSQCPPHCLPYGVILEEYAARRPEELRRAAVELIGAAADDADKPSWDKLRAALHDLDVKQNELERLKGDPATPVQVIEKLEAEYQAANKRLYDALWVNLHAKLVGLYALYDGLDKKKGEPDTSSEAVDRLQADCQKADLPLRRLLHRMSGVALCLSGGGIRSASFCLGVLEGLARFSRGLLPVQSTDAPPRGKGLLDRLDYLSTVSGGGYIGSWLSAWIYRRCDAATTNERLAVEAAYRHVEDVAAKTGDAKTRLASQDLAKGHVKAAVDALHAARRAKLEGSYREVVSALAGQQPTTSGDPAPGPIRHVRQYTSYLAPALGASLDSWTLLAIVLRNMFINWLMLLPLLLAAVALPQVVYFASREIAFGLSQFIAARIVAAALVLLLFYLAARFASNNLPSHRGKSDPGPSAGAIAWRFVIPVLFANWLLVELWWSINGDSANKSGVFWIVVGVVAVVTLAGVLALCTGILRTNTKAVLRSTHYTHNGNDPLASRWLPIYAAGLVSAAIAIALAVWFYLSVVPALAQWQVDFQGDQRLLVTFGLPLIMLIPLLTVSLLSGLLGGFEKEEDREWWSRAGAFQLALLVGWIGGCAVALYGGALYRQTFSSALSFSAGGGLLGGLGSALGWSGKTSPGPRPVKSAQAGKIGPFLEKHNLLLPAICGLALLLLALGAANVEGLLADGVAGFWGEAGLAVHGFIFLMAVALAFILNRAISINLFSLNGMYRMRLMRAFLGASYTRRQPDPFTGFDPRDTPVEARMPQSSGAPLHLINTTLNLVGTKRAAWRQRKAEGFSFSPLHCGSWRIGYVPTRFYGGDDGPTLATAMTISGAAFNPNMGYHSSPLVTLMMTFFNVRLGWWVPNPRREEGAHGLMKPFSRKGKEFLRCTGPSFALEPLILEAFGNTDDTYRWIELTDGGHFENLGLYEMVLRRCKNIIVVDAGADPKCEFEDLGNALRKIQIDLGIPIKFSSLPMHAGAQKNNRYCAVAEIDYGCVDNSPDLTLVEKQALSGTLIYIKASITGDEPPDIKQYSLTHPDFPHETTANQFFNEAQFESYRHLGSVAVEKIVTERKEQTESETPGEIVGALRRLFRGLRRDSSPSQTHPAAPPENGFGGFGQAATAHAEPDKQ